jgi:hypothetical protein
MTKFAKLLKTWTGTMDWQAAKFERQEFICKLLLKNADISNPVSVFVFFFQHDFSRVDIIRVDRFWFRNNGHRLYNKNGHVNINSRII